MNNQANKEKMRSLDIKRICASMTSLVDSTNEKRRKYKQHNRALEDEDYDPFFDEDNDHIGRERECDQELVTPGKKKQVVTKGGQNRIHFIPPLSLASVAKKSNMQRQEVLLGENGIRSVNFGLEEKKQAAISRHQLNTYDDLDLEDNQDDIDLDDFSNEEFTRLMEKNRYSGTERGSGTKRKRGDVYCRKLTALAPGEKICLEYDKDGNPIGENASLFAFFLGEQVRKKVVCPIQVKDWTEYKPETLDHYWNCILEKFEFDNPDLRKQDVMRHARSLFRNSRHKLRRKYILKPKLKTKEAELNAKPTDMTIADSTYLVHLWRSKKFQ